MLSDYSRYHGSALIQLLEHFRAPISVVRLEECSQGFYLLDGRIALYLKFSRNRKGPWSFTFRPDHRLQYIKTLERYGNCLVTLICGKDGIVALRYDQISEVLDDEFSFQSSITIRRKLNHMYSVNGPKGSLFGKIGRDSLVQQVAVLLNLPIAPSLVVGEDDVDASDLADDTA